MKKERFDLLVEQVNLKLFEDILKTYCKVSTAINPLSPPQELSADSKMKISSDKQLDMFQCHY